MKLDIKDLPARITPIVTRFKKYFGFSMLLLYLLLCSLMVVRINQLASKEPNESDLVDKLTNVQRPKIDKDSVNKLQMLQDQNIEVKTLFNEARNNPFSE